MERNVLLVYTIYACINGPLLPLNRRTLFPCLGFFCACFVSELDLDWFWMDGWVLVELTR